MSIEAMKQALEALEAAPTSWRAPEAQAALRQAIEQAEKNQFNPDWDAMAVMVEEQQRMAKRIEELEQAEKQEPVAYINVEQRKLEWAKYTKWGTPTVVNLPKIPLYTTPQPQREWVGLTDEDRREVWLSREAQTPTTFAEGIEAKLRSKNT